MKLTFTVGHLMKKVDTSNCETCGVFDYVQHLLVYV